MTKPIHNTFDMLSSSNEMNDQLLPGPIKRYGLFHNFTQHSTDLLCSLLYISPWYQEPQWGGRLYIGGTETSGRAGGFMEGAVTSATNIATQIQEGPFI